MEGRRLVGSWLLGKGTVVVGDRLWEIMDECLGFVAGDYGGLMMMRRRWMVDVERRVVRCVGGRDVVTVLDYGAGNVRSLENAVRRSGFRVRWVKEPEDILSAEKLLFPGVGSFGVAMENLVRLGYDEALVEYIGQDRPFLGICLGLQTLFEASEESPGVSGLGILPGKIRRFRVDESAGGAKCSVPHIGWNEVYQRKACAFSSKRNSSDSLLDSRFYFVHSFRLGYENQDFVLTTTRYGDEEFVSAIQFGNIIATQFHPEKSGESGVELLGNFLREDKLASALPFSPSSKVSGSGLAKRVVACLDVRENDEGDLVVTKGDQYDVREKTGEVRNLGKPVSLAHRYFDEGADEITFLNITSFRGEPLTDAPMIEVLERCSEGVFVPLCIGGGIRAYEDKDGVRYSALEVAAQYFRAGADKVRLVIEFNPSFGPVTSRLMLLPQVSIGSDAVYSAEQFWALGGEKDGTSSIETISKVYGAQAVVVSVDPRRIWISDPSNTTHTTIRSNSGPGPDGEEFCWYQCTVKGGREGRDLDVVQLVKAVEALGAGEILLNSMDADGSNAGYDLDLIGMVREAVSIPVIASSGAGKPEHFVECFQKTNVEAALAAGIFHRQEVGIVDVKACMASSGLPVRVSS